MVGEASQLSSAVSSDDSDEDMAVNDMPHHLKDKPVTVKLTKYRTDWNVSAQQDEAGITEPFDADYAPVKKENDERKIVKRKRRHQPAGSTPKYCA